MQTLMDFLTFDNFKLLLIPLLVAFVTQLAKFVWQGVRAKKLNWAALNFYGGMPSTHTAIMVSLVTEVVLHEGVASPLTAVVAIYAAITIRDAIGLRGYLSAHSKALNIIVKDLPDNDQWQFQHFRERIGHTPLEALVGGIVGLLLGLSLYALLPGS